MSAVSLFSNAQCALTQRAVDQGVLRVDLLDGDEIRGVDRGGKSDPFAVFTLNGQKVYKSQTKKKTLRPEWNESFTASIVRLVSVISQSLTNNRTSQPSRVKADFSVEIFDWNQIEQAKSLGEGTIDVVNLEPFEAKEILVNLVSTKHGEKGVIRLRVVFTPEIIAKERKNTSTFSTAGRAMTVIGGLPGQAGKGVFHGVHGAAHGVHGLFKRDKSGKDDDAEDEALPPSLPTGQASQPVGVSPNLQMAATTFPASTENLNGADNGPGTLRITVLSAKDLAHQDIKPYATIRVGDKEFKTKHTGKTNAPEWYVSVWISRCLRVTDVLAGTRASHVRHRR